MPHEILNIDTYFKRIHYSGNKNVSFETLYGLHTAHTMNIPFENIDVYLGRPVSLDPDSLYKKIVENKRGGYCFEMNGLFSMILKQLGFKVSNLLARVIRDGIEYTAKTHQVLLVEIEDVKYLADVGFGNKGITAPILFKENIEQMQFTQIYRIVNSKYGYVLQNKGDKDYLSMYVFTIEECLPVDYDMSNFYSYANPKSIFRSMKFITKPTLTGRLTLTENHLKILDNGQETVTVLSSDKEYNEHLLQYFGIDMELIESTVN